MEIHYPIKWTEQDHFELEAKGWLSDVTVITNSGHKYSMCFYDPTRLAQDLEEEIKSGKSAIIEKGLVVVSKLTKKNIEAAIAQAESEGYFA